MVDIVRRIIDPDNRERAMLVVPTMTTCLMATKVAVTNLMTANLVVTSIVTTSTVVTSLVVTDLVVINLVVTILVIVNLVVVSLISYVEKVTLKMRLVLGMAVLLLVTIAATFLAVAVTLAEITSEAGNILRGLTPRGLIRRCVRNSVKASLAAAIRTSTSMTVHLSVEVPGLLKRRLVRLVGDLIIKVTGGAGLLPTNPVLVMVLRAKADPATAYRLMDVSLMPMISAAADVIVPVAMAPVQTLRFRAMAALTSTGSAVKLTDPVSMCLVLRALKPGDAVAHMPPPPPTRRRMSEGLVRMGLAKRVVEVKLADLGRLIL
jgi:hypothetical protein